MSLNKDAALAPQRAFMGDLNSPRVLAEQARTMLPVSSQSGSLRDSDCVAIVGGGPSGSLFAIHLLQEAERLSGEASELFGPSSRAPGLLTRALHLPPQRRSGSIQN